MHKLTEKQSAILSYIRDRIRHDGMPPTRAEIADHFGFRSKTAAVDHLRALSNKGYIELLNDQSRGIRLKNTPQNDHDEASNQDMDDFIELPVIGKVAAGLPIEAIENREEKICVPKTLFRTHPTYLLRVRGDSMRDAGILDGDLIAVHKTEFAHKGQIVVARVEQDVTVKYLDQENDMVKLLPANSSFQPILVSPEDLFIEGVFVGLIRNAEIRL